MEICSDIIQGVRSVQCTYIHPQSHIQLVIPIEVWKDLSPCLGERQRGLLVEQVTRSLESVSACLSRDSLWSPAPVLCRSLCLASSVCSLRHLGVHTPHPTLHATHDHPILERKTHVCVEQSPQKGWEGCCPPSHGSQTDIGR